MKGSKYVGINSFNNLYVILSTVNGYFDEMNKRKYLTLTPTNKNKEKFKKSKELYIKIRDLILSISKNSDDYDEIYMKTEINSYVELPLNRTIKIPYITIVVRDVFQ